MRGYIVSCLGILALVTIGCTNDQTFAVIQKRHIHKYGYDVSEEEWHAQAYPGQVITMLNNGQTIVESYEDGYLHGPKTVSFPHSQTVQTLEHYEKGQLQKRITYNVRGVPQQQEVFANETDCILTTWYSSGTPKSREEYTNTTLTQGHYYSMTNELDSSVQSGCGERTIRNGHGDLLTREVFQDYDITYVETYYPNNCPHTATSFKDGLLHGDSKIFTMEGDPIQVIPYDEGREHGIATFYQNGNKYLEISYSQGIKDGYERFYTDGDTLTKETPYICGRRHGASVIYCDGSARTTWYYYDEKVSKKRYDTLNERLEMITCAH